MGWREEAEKWEQWVGESRGDEYEIRALRLFAEALVERYVGTPVSEIKPGDPVDLMLDRLWSEAKTKAGK